MRTRIWLISLSLLMTLTAFGCGASSPEAVAKAYFTAMQKGELDKAAAMQVDGSSESMGGDFTSAVVRAYTSRMSFAVGTAIITGDRATVPVQLTAPDLEQIMGALFGEMLPNAMNAAFAGAKMPSQEAIEERLIALVLDAKAPMSTTTEQMLLVKVKSTWKIDNRP